jgi:hypothetical protein
MTLIQRAPMTQRIGNNILPINAGDNFYQPSTEGGEFLRIIDSAQTVLQGLIDSVVSPSTVVDNDASFTPDLVGKVIYQINTVSGTDAGNCLRAPIEKKFAVIAEVIDAHTLKLTRPIFSPVSSLYYAIDNHTGKILTSSDGYVTSVSAGKLIDASATFVAGMVGKYVAITSDGEYWNRAKISAVDSPTQLSIDYNHATSIGFKYKIILTDDAYRYINSAGTKESSSNELSGLSIIIKDGTYYESIYTQCFVTSTPGDYPLCIYSGDYNMTGVIISGAKANATTTAVNSFGFMFSNGRYQTNGVKLRYYASSFYFGTITRIELTNVDVDGGANYLISCEHSTTIFTNVHIHTLAQAIFQQLRVAIINSMTVYVANTRLITQWGSYNTDILFWATPTLNGAGTLINDQGQAGSIYNKGGAITYHSADGTMFVQGFLSTNKTAITASAGAQTLPANPVGFISIYVNGTLRKIPYYAT